MITPSFAITATERILPRLAIDFTTATLDPRITFTRSGNTATVTNSSGVIVGINADLPRFDFNPTTLVCRGLLIEESRTNVLLNSLINGTNLATQSVTVTAAARTLTFYGTGQIVLSGAASATVTGTGAYPTRTTLTFTPSAGTLTLTVTGTVQFAQLELGLFATSFIPTAGLAVTRNTDIATMTGTNFSSWFNASEGAVYHEVTPIALTGQSAYSIDNGTNNESIYSYDTSARYYYRIRASAATQVTISSPPGTAVVGTTTKCVTAYKSANFGISANGAATSTAASGNLPSGVNRLQIAPVNNLYFRKLMYWFQRPTNAEVQAFCK